MATKAKAKSRSNSNSRSKDASKVKASDSQKTVAAVVSKKADAAVSAAGKARKVITDNATGKNALFALLGAGALALVSTEAGRGMLKSAASYLSSLAEDAMGSIKSTSEDASDAAESRA